MGCNFCDVNFSSIVFFSDEMKLQEKDPILSLTECGEVGGGGKRLNQTAVISLS